jgi:hypothetical protein
MSTTSWQKQALPSTGQVYMAISAGEQGKLIPVNELL